MYMLLYLKQKTNEDENIKKKKQCKKIPSEQKPQPNRIGKPEGGALTP